MEEIARLDHVYQYNELMGIETLHPLVSVIDMSKCPRMRHSRRLYGFYCIFLKDVKCGDLRYGRNYYDYQEGTLVFTARDRWSASRITARFSSPKAGRCCSTPT